MRFAFSRSARRLTCFILGITVSSDRSPGPGSAESRRLRENARARKALNAAVCRKLAVLTQRELEAQEREAESRSMVSTATGQQRDPQGEGEEQADIGLCSTTTTEDEGVERNGKGGETTTVENEEEVVVNCEECEVEGEEDLDEEVEEEEEELEESVVEFFERLMRESAEEREQRRRELMEEEEEAVYQRRTALEICDRGRKEWDRMLNGDDEEEDQQQRDDGENEGEWRNRCRGRVWNGLLFFSGYRVRSDRKWTRISLWGSPGWLICWLVGVILIFSRISNVDKDFVDVE